MADTFYQGKNILITGCTGFVGKVLLEKILFSLPQIKKVFVFIRPKKGSLVQERFRKEILDSLIFDRLKQRENDFDSFMLEKVQPIAGDLQQESLALDPTDRSFLIENLDIIISSAASVDFNQRLDQALQINTLGTLRVLDLAKSCKNLVAYVHVSTAYVNCIRKGWVEEKIYPMSQNPQSLLQELLNMTVAEIEQKTPDVLGNFPNTYTFTKSLTENLMQELGKDLPLCILRPTCIGGSWKEPVAGWVDTVSAVGAFNLALGLGIMKVTNGNWKIIIDQIPVDTVANAIIMSAFLLCKPQNLEILHVGSSSTNPASIETNVMIVTAYWQRFPPEKAFAKSKVRFIKSDTAYKAVYALQRQAPVWVYKKIGQFTGNAEIIKKAARFQKGLNKEQAVSSAFSHFLTNNWVFSTQKLAIMEKLMSKDDIRRFPIDVSKLDWRSYMSNFSYGLRKFVLRENVETPSSDPHALNLNWDYRTKQYFSDIMWAYNHGEPINIRHNKDIKNLILNGAKVQETIRRIVEEQKSGKDVNKAIAEQVKKAEFIMDRMLCDIKMPLVRVFGWFLRKVWRIIYERIEVNQEQLLKINELKKQNSGPIVLVPTHRSYIDFLIMSYIFFANDIKVPCIAAAEEFLKITLVNHILRVSGAFFIKRRVAGDHLYMAILSEYVQQLLKDSQILEFFIEGTRSRSGKTLHPKFGILSMCTEAYFEGLVPNVHFVPITINYERVLEGETFPFELLGEEKVKESLMRLAKSIKTLNMNFGKIEIVVNDPISIKDFCFKNPSLDPSNLQDRDILNKKLGFEIVYTLQDNTVIMPTSLTATILLMHTRGVTEDELVAKVDWLRNEIRARGYKVGGMNGGSGATEVKNAICHLNDFITRKKDIFEPSVSLKSEYKNILMLSYYRNALHHIFIIEALIACTLNRFSTKNNQDIPKEKIISESVFLWNLIEREFVCRNSTSQVDTLEFTIQSMIKRGYIIENSNNIQIQPSGEMAIAFLSSLLWPMIDSYWITLMFSVALRTRPQLTFDRIVQSVQMYAEIMYEERSMYFYESCSQENIKNALHTYEKMGIIGKTTADKSLALTNEYITNESKLEELVDHIGNFRKTSLIRTNSTFEDLKRSIIDEFPLMPKI